MTKDARSIMVAFAVQTGLAPEGRRPRRYLWTDAFAVCTFLTLHRRTGEDQFRRFAVELVDQVHAVLGRHREDDPRSGWISGLDEAGGAERPTAGGLRIGKALNERAVGEPYDDRSEWDRDGQYFHYLTKWMHALERVASATAEPGYLRWAIDLAKVAHAAFAYAAIPGATKRMYWKMSIDLSRPLVPSMGLHDPLDAYVTYSELRASARRHPDGLSAPDLGTEIAETLAMCKGRDMATDDPLGIGGLLFDACRVCRLTDAGALATPGLLDTLLQSSRSGLDAFLRKDPLSTPVSHRLAFRELGLSIGLRGVASMREIAEHNRRRFSDNALRDIEDLVRYVPLSEAIENFWRDPMHQQSPNWQAHLDINMVMLATSLAPDEFLSV